jgi:hypothetical protein
MLDTATLMWTDLSNNCIDTMPSPRDYHGFVFASNKLYVHGGHGQDGEAFLLLSSYSEPVLLFIV